VIGKDTRLSCYMIETALQAGFLSVGIDVLPLGPIPTPAVAMLTRSMRADLGVMISASHNPFEDNGIKLFGPDGYKLSDDVELEIEALIDSDLSSQLAKSTSIGRAKRVESVHARYIEFAKRTLPRNMSLEGLRIAIDPGHIGGKWVTWDDRHFKLGGPDSLEVREGEMTLMVAKILRRDLTLLGAEVFLTRESNHPVTKERVETLQEEAKAYLIKRGQVPSAGLIASTAKAMFAISAEIRARGELINETIRPDLALCLHFDASPWPGGRPVFRSPNHLHLILNGCYSESEMEEDDTRFEMVLRILQRLYHEELRLSDTVSKTLQHETRLPAFGYDGTSGMSVNDNDLVWARNLLANRVFFCPVLFFEPFCMNHQETHARVQEGPYPGLREINGVYRKNLYQEYADGVTAGLVRYYREQRQKKVSSAHE
jgi:hypothetical protein